MTTNKLLQKFYIFIEEDLKDREEAVTLLVERGDAPIGAVGNEKALANLVKEAVKEYILRFKEK